MGLPSNANMSNATGKRVPNSNAMANPMLGNGPSFFCYGLQPNKQLHFAGSIGARCTTQPNHGGLTNGSINTNRPNPQQRTASNGNHRFHPYAHQQGNFFTASSMLLNNQAAMSNCSSYPHLANGGPFIPNGSHPFNHNAHQYASSIGESRTTTSYHTALNNGSAGTQACQLGPPFLTRQNMPMVMPYPTSTAAAPQTAVVHNSATKGIQQPQQRCMTTTTITTATMGLSNSSDHSALQSNPVNQPVNVAQVQDKHHFGPSSASSSNMAAIFRTNGGNL